MANPLRRKSAFPSKALWSAVGLSIASFVAFLPPRTRATPSTDPVSEERESLLNDNWDPGKIYAILSSPNAEASDNLYRAAFAAGRPIIPKLQAALKDDRTAEFAAQSLAYLGGEKALDILATLVDDPRSLDLRRFYYGALGESDDPRSMQILLEAVTRSDHEPDRTVTENAILALSLRSDPSLVPKLRQAEAEVTDPVIQDDINTAATVIELRAQYLATPGGKDSGSSPTQAIRTYFMPALEGPPGGIPPEPAGSGAQAQVRSLTYSPEKTRVLAYVDFETSEALARYRLVLQKRQETWKVSSVWLGQELKKTSQPSQPAGPK
jgi:HEAT repeats